MFLPVSTDFLIYKLVVVFFFNFLLLSLYEKSAKEEPVVSRIVALSSVIRGNGSEIVALSSACHIVV
jgi:hypothetical protein